MKEYVKFGFGVTMGFAMAKILIETLNEMVKKAMEKNEDNEEPEEKKEDIWEETLK